MKTEFSSCKFCGCTSVAIVEVRAACAHCGASIGLPPAYVSGDIKPWLVEAWNCWAAPHSSQHPDDTAVDCFAQKMKDKLSQARAMGRSGWPSMSSEELSQQLRHHVTKGDPVDVANYCMFLSGQDAGISPASERPRPAGLR